MEWTVDSPSRLDAFLAAHCEGLTRTMAQKMIKGGGVTVNSKMLKKSSHALREGDVVVCSDVKWKEESEKRKVDAVNLDLEVLYEDDACMILNKPAGIAVHPGHAMEEDEVTLLSGIAHLFQQKKIPFSDDAVLVHRLDKGTTGCLCIAKDKQSFDALQEQFEHRTVQKHYLAVVAGVPEKQEAMIDAPIGRNLTDRTKMSVFKTQKSREAQTSYKVLDASDDAALLLCDLHTGRTHQIRVHLSSINHPLLGDSAYSSPANVKLSKHYEVEEILLHAWKLQLQSPVSGEVISVEAPLSGHFASALEVLQLKIER